MFSRKKRTSRPLWVRWELCTLYEWEFRYMGTVSKGGGNCSVSYVAVSPALLSWWWENGHLCSLWSKYTLSVHMGEYRKLINNQRNTSLKLMWHNTFHASSKQRFFDIIILGEMWHSAKLSVGMRMDRLPWKQFSYLTKTLKYLYLGVIGKFIYINGWHREFKTRAMRENCINKCQHLNIY